MPKVDTTVTESRIKDSPPPKAEELAYPDLKVTKAFGENALTGPLAKTILHLEDEDEYGARICAEENIQAANGKLPKIDLKKTMVTESGGPVTDFHGKKLVAWNNEHNRGVNMDETNGYAQSVLTRKWVGPTTLPGQTVNGETISISRRGQIVSGQKRLLAVYLAWQEWLANPEQWLANWPKEQFPDGPVLESLLVYGVSDDIRVVQSVDNVQTRSEADIFLVGGAVESIFGAAEVAKLDPRGRAEACRLLQAAVDFVWDRFGMSDALWRTRSAAQQFLLDHPRIHKCVKHVFEEDSKDAGRPLSFMRLARGACAGSMYLMAAGKTNPGKEHNTERDLDMTLWAKAEEFWALVARKQGGFKTLADCLVRLMDSEEEMLSARRAMTVARAWHLWLAGSRITADALKLETITNPDGEVSFTNPPDFGGKDRGPKLPKQPDERETVPTPAAVAASKAAIRDANAALLKRKNEAAKAAPQQKPRALTPTPTTAKPAVKITTGAKPAAPAKKPTVAAAKK